MKVNEKIIEKAIIKLGFSGIEQLANACENVEYDLLEAKVNCSIEKKAIKFILLFSEVCKVTLVKAKHEVAKNSIK